MNCPYCSEGSTKVVDTRDTGENEVRRRRECRACGERFTTYERVESPSLRVVKQDGSEEQFRRDKIRDGIERACNKRPVSEEEIEDIVDQVESEIRSRNNRTVEADEIGEAVMERLKELDDVAYLRFASVYRDFEDADSFKEELEELEREGS
ncbi:MAG: transcriptional regulator NrdR [Candidatus Nanohaloarchaea archaeon]|nr:transcriptional regulator NrdR [Candidatus Nanohaloarchaea archaeon]